MPAQVKMIDSINRLLSQNDSAIQLNPEGVCGGLVCLKIRYRLEGRELEFFDLCRKLANPPKDYVYGQGDKLDLFIREIEIEFNRNKYTKAKSLQGDMENSVFIEGKPIKKEFAIGLVESKANWAKLLEQLHNDGRSCYLASHNHAIEMTFANGRYEIYDPNYDEDSPNQPASITQSKNIRTFTKASDVIHELSRQFGYPDDQVGLSIHIYAHPTAPQPGVYPDKSTLVKGFTKSDFDRQIGITDTKWIYNSLYFAAFVNDKETIQAYLDNNLVSPYQAAYLMHTEQWNAELIKLFHKKDEQNQLHLLTYALWQGNFSLFTQLVKDYEATLTTLASQNKWALYIGKEFNFLVKAAECRNAGCLKTVFELYKQYNIDYTNMPHATLSTIIKKISKKGDIDSLKTLMHYLPNLPLSYLKEGFRFAAEYDRQPIVKFFIDAIEQRGKQDKSEATTEQTTAKERNLSLKSVQRLSLPVFKRLLQLGFNVHSTSISQLLKRKDLHFFEEWLQHTPEAPYRDLIDLKQNPDLSERFNLTVFQILCRYGRNELIEKNWTEEANSFGDQALQFACETGNKKMVEFLTGKGFRLETAYQVSTLKKALDNFEFDKVQAVLATVINSKEFFSEANKPLINRLISAGEMDFIFRSWKELSATQRQDYMFHAVSDSNQEFCKRVAARYPTFSSSFIAVLLDVYKENNQHRQAIDAALYLADSLKMEPFIECIQKLNRKYNQALLMRVKTDDPFTEKAFLAEARQSIGGLITLLMYAIEKHHFDLAIKMMPYVQLNQEEQQQILVKAYTRKDTAILEFMLEYYRGFRLNPENYFSLETQKEYGLLAKLLEGEQILSDQVYMALLKSAVARQDERIISLLSRHINSAYRPQGSPVYSAIEQRNVGGIFLLLKYRAKINQYPIPGALLTLAMQQETADLLHALLKEPDFLNYFNQELGENLNRLFKYGTPAVVLYAVDKVNLTEKYDEFLLHALTHDDVELLQRLKETPQFKSSDWHKLFAQACEHQACAVVNELLANPLAFADKKALHRQLDQLFGVAEPQSDIDAQAIYERVYPKALYRLYEFVKKEHYRPFASLYSSIYEIIGDEALLKTSQVKSEHRQGLLRNRLIRNAFDKGDLEILDRLLKQLENKPLVNKEIIAIFLDNLQKPLIINVLLTHFSLDEVIKEAIAQRQGLVIVTLLSERLATAISNETMQLLQEHSELLLAALSEKSKNQLALDPRHKLNALVIQDSPLALAQALKNQTLAIKKLITEIQELMIQGKHDLKMHFYDFQLQDKVIAGFKAMEEIEPLIEKWTSQLPVYGTKKEAEANLKTNAMKLLELPQAQEDIREIRSHLAKNELVPHHFDEHEQPLLAFFEALRQLEAEAPLELNQKPKELPVNHDDIVEVIIIPAAKRSPDTPLLKRMLTLLDTYTQERDKRGQTKHWLSWFQYTKDDKFLAINHLKEALASPAKGINRQDEGALLDGNLYTSLNTFIASNIKGLTKELGSKRDIRSLPDLIDFLNTRDPLLSLIDILEQYHAARGKQPERYHWSIFSQFTRTEKQSAATQFISLLKGESVSLSKTDLSALVQGSLGEEIEKFIELYGTQLQQKFGCAIDSIEDLILACDKLSAHSLVS